MSAFWLGREWLLTSTRRRHDRQRAAAALGKPLKSSQPVHHHSITQIVICDSSDYHWLLHRRERVVRAGGDPNNDIICSRCDNPRPKSGFSGYYCEYCKLAVALQLAISASGVTIYGPEDDWNCPEPTWSGLAS